MVLSSFKRQHATYHLKSGALLAYPTEAVYGLGCDPLNEAAVLELLALKKRAITKGLILIAANFSQLDRYLDYNETIRQRIHTPYEETITWLIPAQKWVPKWLTGHHQTLAVRVTHHPIAKTLCESFNAPIISTSANPSHLAPAQTAFQVRCYFPKATQLNIVAGKTGENKATSKIYNAFTGQQLR
jgi:L-threonylcarbamoyladenylate synthase